VALQGSTTTYIHALVNDTKKHCKVATLHYKEDDPTITRSVLCSSCSMLNLTINVSASPKHIVRDIDPENEILKHKLELSSGSPILELAINIVAMHQQSTTTRRRKK
jgi:hypothetical protein